MKKDPFQRLADELNASAQADYEIRMRHFQREQQAWKDHIQERLDQGMPLWEAWLSADAHGLRMSILAPPQPPIYFVA